MNPRATRRFVAYYRVSTDRQGQSGLGLDAQRKAIADYLNGGAWELVGEFTEVESGKKIRTPGVGSGDGRLPETQSPLGDRQA
jgi:Resolvase, N terminal domain